ncbi:MAG: hypothetical protein LBF61_00895 [Azoarcus sp.]|jgi:Mor family transcriptional regulator|nr:hypothetical protein [Azoarcus sp.]
MGAPGPHPLPPVSGDILATLPPVLRAVVRALGVRRAQEWLRDYGGVNVVIPRAHTTALGLSDAELRCLRATLALHLDAGGRVWLPKADKLLIRARDAAIRRERAQTSISRLAGRYGLSSRHIVNICREGVDGEPDQLLLF